MSSIVPGSGKVLKDPKIALIFWGAGWNKSPAISVEEFAGVFSSILVTPYMAKMSQYNGICGARITSITVDTSKEFTEKINGAPGFHKSDLTDMLALHIDNGTIPFDSNILYMVISELSVVCIETAPQAAAGFHDSFQHAGSVVHYAWVSNSGSLINGNMVPKTFVHELVEASSDPELDSFKRGSDGQEIGDLCNDQFVTMPGIRTPNAPGGIVVQKYFSDRENTCVLPTEYSLKWWADTTNTDVSRGVKQFLPGGNGSIKSLMACGAVPPRLGFGISVRQEKDQTGGRLTVDGERFTPGGSATILINYVPNRTLTFQRFAAVKGDGTFSFSEEFVFTSTDPQDAFTTIAITAIDVSSGNLTTATTDAGIWVSA